MSGTAGNPKSGKATSPQTAVAAQASNRHAVGKQLTGAATSWEQKLQSPAVLISVSLGFGLFGVMMLIVLAIVLSRPLPTERPADLAKTALLEPDAACKPADPSSDDLPNPNEQIKASVDEQQGGHPEPLKPSQPSPEPSTPKDDHDPFVDIRNKTCLLLLPHTGVGTGDRGNLGPELAKLFVMNPKQCELAIAGAQDVLPPGCDFLIERSDNADRATWNVRYKQSNSLSSPPLVAAFHWQKQSLFFQWEGAKKEKYSLLKYCLLKLKVGDRTETCQLHKPEEMDAAVLDFFASPMRHPWSLTASAFPNPDHILWDYQIAGFPETSNGLPVGIENDQGTRIGVGKSRPQAKFGIIPGDEKKRVDVEMYMEVEKDPGLAFGCLTRFYRIQALDKQPDLQFRPINPAALSEIKTKNSQYDSKRLERIIFQHRNDKPPLVDALNKANAAIQDNQGKKQRMKEGSDASVLDREIKKHEAEKAKIQAAIDALDALARNEEIMKENRAKCEFLESFFREIQPPSKAAIKPSPSNARIECRIYLEVDGVEVVILQTKGFRTETKSK